MQYACITQNYACITQNYASLRKSFTQQLRRHYAENTQIHYAKLRKNYANNLRNHYAVITQCLRKITQRCLRTIRINYAKMFTQTLRTFPMLTQLYYSDFTQIIYAIHYAVYAIQLRKYIYAITIISLRRLRKYRFSLRKFTQWATC